MPEHKVLWVFLCVGSYYRRIWSFNRLLKLCKHVSCCDTSWGIFTKQLLLRHQYHKLFLIGLQHNTFSSVLFPSSFCHTCDYRLVNIKCDYNSYAKSQISILEDTYLSIYLSIYIYIYIYVQLTIQLHRYKFIHLVKCMR
jgi:hypothetical protein